MKKLLDLAIGAATLPLMLAEMARVSYELRGHRPKLAIAPPRTNR